MSCLIPFKYDIQLYPTQTFGTRWERVRELERWGNQIQTVLTGYSRENNDATWPSDTAQAGDPALNIAQPGGGCSRSFDRFGWEYGGVAVKPAFGSYPAQATVIGFYDPGTVDPITPIDLAGGTWPDATGTEAYSSDANAVAQTYPDTQVFCCGKAISGPKGATPWANGPNPAVDAEVSALKANIETALSYGMPGSFQFTTFRIEVRGVIYGYAGYHFPQPNVVPAPITEGQTDVNPGDGF